MLSGLADKKIFYGWYMVGAAVGLQFLQAGLVTQAFGAYLAVLADEQGWTLGQEVGWHIRFERRVGLLRREQSLSPADQCRHILIKLREAFLKPFAEALRGVSHCLLLMKCGR